MARTPDYDVQKEIMKDLEADYNVPWIYRWGRISHYYGDSVRELLITAAILMVVAAPFYTDNLQTELPFVVVGIIALVVAAAITSPQKSQSIGADIVASGVGFIVFETWALLGYSNEELLKFVLREALAVIFLFSLYFSTKTLRAMYLHKMGEVDTPRDFSKDKKPLTDTEKEQLNWREEAKEALEEINDREKFESND